MPTPPAPPSRFSRLRALVTTRTWIAVAVAFAIGLLLFVLIWSKQRAKNDFFRIDEPQRSASGRELEPLPGPDTGRIEKQTAPAPPASTAPADAPTDALPADDLPPVADAEQTTPDGNAPLETFGPQQALGPRTDPSTAGPASSDTAPVPLSNPSPRYPPAALRRGDGGEVLLRVHVGADGVPKQIDLVDGSGSGLLDRAATEAVRGWRFRPALRGGQPVDGTVQVPIRFSPGR